MKKLLTLLVTLAFFGLSMNSANAQTTDFTGDYTGDVKTVCQLLSIDETFHNIEIALRTSAYGGYDLMIDSIDMGGGVILPPFTMSTHEISPDGTIAPCINFMIIPRITIPPNALFPSGTTLYDVPLTVKLTSGSVSDDTLTFNLDATATVMSIIPINFKLIYSGLKNYGNLPGSGTEQDPYLIKTAGHLKYLADFVNFYQGSEQTKGKYYKLMKNIDLSAYSTSNEGMGWMPIGCWGKDHAFRGIFDGNKKKITGLKINISQGADMMSVGLFAYLDGAIIKNLGIENADIYVGDGPGYGGGLAGQVIDTKIINCYTSGTLSITSTMSNAVRVGGLVGDCAAFKSIHTSITNSYSTMRVGAYSLSDQSSVFAGGLMGGLFAGTITSCYATGEISAQSSKYVPCVGGVIGHIQGTTIENCAALNPKISCIGSQSGCGRVVGLNVQDNTLINNIGLGNMINPKGDTIWTNTGLNANNGQDFYKEGIDLDGSLGGRFTSAGGWVIRNGELPRLFVRVPKHWSLLEGKGTRERPYLIKRIDDMLGLAYYVNLNTPTKDVHFKLTENIDLSNLIWIPIGCFPIKGKGVCSFQGNFDGNSKKITGMRVSDNTLRYAGLFGYLEEGTVENLTIEDCAVSCKDMAGSLVGLAEKATVRNCRTTGRVTSTAGYAGGLAGIAYDSDIATCYTTCRVSSTGDYTGGLVAANRIARLSDCYAKSDVTSTGNFVGGLVGSNDVDGATETSNISYCYATGVVIGDDHVGGLVGYNDKATVRNSVAANERVAGTGNRICRVVGTVNSGECKNNYARKDMVLESSGAHPGVSDCGKDMPIDTFYSRFFYSTAAYWHDNKPWDISETTAKWNICHTKTLPWLRSEKIDCGNTGINNPNSNETSEITVYPNPTNGELHVQSSKFKVQNVEVYDVMGKKISSHHLITTSSNHLIDISHFTSGIYLLKITTETGTVTKKIVKQ